MKGVVIEKTGGTEVLLYKEDLPVPELKDGEVLVKNEFIGINYIDTYVLQLPSLDTIFILNYTAATTEPVSTLPLRFPTSSAAKAPAPSPLSAPTRPPI